MPYCPRPLFTTSLVRTWRILPGSLSGLDEPPPVFLPVHHVSDIACGIRVILHLVEVRMRVVGLGRALGPLGGRERLTVILLATMC